MYQSHNKKKSEAIPCVGIYSAAEAPGPAAVPTLRNSPPEPAATCLPGSNFGLYSPVDEPGPANVLLIVVCGIGTSKEITKLTGFLSFVGFNWQLALHVLVVD